MKNNITSIILLVISIIFCMFQMVLNKEPCILNIVTPTILQIDLNGNKIADDNETFCIPEITTFTANLKKNSEPLARQMGLTYSQAVSIGYLTDDYAQKTLIGKRIKLEQLPDKKTDCQYAKITVEDKDYKSLLEENGFAIVGNKPVSENKFKELYDNAAKLNLVILNHKSQKYHSLDCKYGQVAEDSVVLLKNEISQKANPCKFCHIDKHFAHNNSESKVLQTVPPSKITDGNIQLILTDFTKILKPDRNCVHAVCKEFVNSVNSAKNTIEIALYGWEEIPAVEKAINDAIHRGIKIRIVYDVNSKGENYYTGTFNFVNKFDNKISDRNPSNLKQADMLMHNKFAIFDGEKVYTGSMNFSVTGFSGFNHNHVLIINSKQIADLYLSEFEQMYSGNFHKNKIKSKNNIDLHEGESKISVYFSPQDKGITSSVIDIIKNSKKYVYMPVFLLTHRALANELINAMSRGVDVRVILDATKTYGLHSVFGELRQKGLPIKVENYAGKMHSKAIIVDDEYLVLGSTNFSNSGENKNDENMLVIKNSRLANFYKEYFLYFWSQIPDKYLKQTVRAESKNSIGSCYDGVDNNFDGKIDNQDEGCKN